MTGTRIAGIALVLAGCAGTQNFDAAERATGLSPEGFSAAEYDMWGEDGNLGEARVWSSGAYKTEVNGQEMTVLEVTLELENNGEQPMTVSTLRLDSLDVDGQRFTDLAPVRVEGPGVVAPGEFERVKAYFAFPERYDPEDIADFRVRWALRQGERIYAQRTPFLQAPDYYYDPYYDPFFNDPFQTPGAPVFLRPYPYYEGRPITRAPRG